MKKIRFLNVAAVLSILISFMIACSGGSTYEHKKEAREIKRERKETDKAISDLSKAVLVTDATAWDSAGEYRTFKDSAMKRIERCNRNISAFKISVKNRQDKIPVRYIKKIDRLEQRSKALTLRLNRYTPKDQADREDFCKLFNYDLKLLEGSIDKLK